ncbi:MAG: hypothetical protein ACREBV_05255 [Candidatus Zixiibacteriota bacterium]
MDFNRKIFEHKVRVKPDDLELFFKHRPECFDKKRGVELLTGLLISRTFEQYDNRPHAIIIPVKKHKLNPPTLEEIIENPTLHVDSDVDLYVQENEIEAHKIQITELEEHYSGGTLDEGLINLIKKKCKRSPDPNLHLVVIADVRGDVNIEKIRNGLEKVNCPFATVLYFGQLGKNIKLGEFSCIMVFPELRPPVNIQLNLR